MSYEPINSRSRNRRRLGAIVASLAIIGAVVMFVSEPKRVLDGAKTSAVKPRTNAADSAMLSVRDGIYTSAQARRADKVYAEQCSSCHLLSMMGKEPAPQLAGDAFMSKWLGSSVGDLYVRISTTMPVSTPGVLSKQQYADVVALLLEANNFPAGNAELTPDREYMNRVKFSSQRALGAVSDQDSRLAHRF